ncbi:MAG: class I SAM-dependent methyltransferase [Spirochaetia bacterium]
MSRTQAELVCPPLIGLISIFNLIRRLQYTAKSVLSPYVTEGMKVVEPGPAIGFFTIELARMVGSQGRVFALDIQSKMLDALRRRALRAGLLDRINLRLVKPDCLGIQDLDGKTDFFLAFFMVHEVPNQRRFFEEASQSLRRGGKLLFVEPKGHVSEKRFVEELGLAAATGLRVESRPAIRGSRTAVLVKDST